MTDYHPREIAARIQGAMRRLPVVVLSGLRQTGKSTLIQREEALTAGRAYHTLDDLPISRKVLTTEPAALIGKTHRTGIMHDHQHATDHPKNH